MGGEELSKQGYVSTAAAELEKAKCSSNPWFVLYLLSVFLSDSRPESNCTVLRKHTAKAHSTS